MGGGDIRGKESKIGGGLKSWVLEKVVQTLFDFLLHLII